MKTIRMPKPLLAAWLEGLRSGQYQQGYGVLCDAFTNSYCCLGVLEMVSGDPEDLDRGIPSADWLKAHSVEFINDLGTLMANPTLVHDKYGDAVRATGANDHVKLTFPQIADLIEHTAEGT